MNKSFNSIVEKNKEAINFVSRMIQSIDTEEEKFFNATKSLFSIIFLKKDICEVGISKHIKSEFNNKKYRHYFKEVSIKEIKSKANPNVDILDKNIDFLDKNDVLWRFKIDYIGEVSFESVIYKNNNNNTFIIYDKYNTTIIKDLNKKEFLLDVTNKVLDRNESDIVLLTKDIDISFFINHDIEKAFFPKIEKKNNSNILKKILKF